MQILVTFVYCIYCPLTIFGAGAAAGPIRSLQLVVCGMKQLHVTRSANQNARRRRLTNHK